MLLRMIVSRAYQGASPRATAGDESMHMFVHVLPPGPEEPLLESWTEGSRLWHAQSLRDILVAFHTGADILVGKRSVVLLLSPALACTLPLVIKP